jgi:hypothetical protein
VDGGVAGRCEAEPALALEVEAALDPAAAPLPAVETTPEGATAGTLC